MLSQDEHPETPQESLQQRISLNKKLRTNGSVDAASH